MHFNANLLLLLVPYVSASGIPLPRSGMAPPVFKPAATQGGPQKFFGGGMRGAAHPKTDGPKPSFQNELLAALGKRNAPKTNIPAPPPAPISAAPPPPPPAHAPAVPDHVKIQNELKEALMKRAKRDPNAPKRISQAKAYGKATSLDKNKKVPTQFEKFKEELAAVVKKREQEKQAKAEAAKAQAAAVVSQQAQQAAVVNQQAQQAAVVAAPVANPAAQPAVAAPVAGQQAQAATPVVPAPISTTQPRANQTSTEGQQLIGQLKDVLAKMVSCKQQDGHKPHHRHAGRRHSTSDMHKSRHAHAQKVHHGDSHKPRHHGDSHKPRHHVKAADGDSHKPHHRHAGRRHSTSDLHKKSHHRQPKTHGNTSHHRGESHKPHRHRDSHKKPHRHQRRHSAGHLKSLPRPHLKRMDTDDVRRGARDMARRQHEAKHGQASGHPAKRVVLHHRGDGRKARVHHRASRGSPEHAKHATKPHHPRSMEEARHHASPKAVAGPKQHHHKAASAVGNTSGPIARALRPFIEHVLIEIVEKVLAVHPVRLGPTVRLVLNENAPRGEALFKHVAEELGEEKVRAELMPIAHELEAAKAKKRALAIEQQ